MSFTSVNIVLRKLSVFVFEDDHPLNGEHDAGGGIDTLSPNEAGLGQFNITLFDDVGGTGDAAGQMTYDMFNMPLSNSLAGTLDPVTGIDACPIAQQASNDSAQAGITGVIPVCPKYEADGVTLSPLAGQAVVANLMPGRYGVVATPAADRIAHEPRQIPTAPTAIAAARPTTIAARKETKDARFITPLARTVHYELQPRSCL